MYVSVFKSKNGGVICTYSQKLVQIQLKGIYRKAGESSIKKQMSYC